jgi:hypothetical protein
VTNVEITRINNFVCPACGEVMRQVTARDGVVKGWCPHAKKEIKVAVNPAKEEKPAESTNKVPKSYLEILQEERAKVLKDMVSAREDGDLKENSAYHAARERLEVLDGKILQEEAKIKQANNNS